MNSRPQAKQASGFAAQAANSVRRLAHVLLTFGFLLPAADAATPVSGVTTFNAVPTQTVLTNASAGANTSHWLLGCREDPRVVAGINFVRGGG